MPLAVQPLPSVHLAVDARVLPEAIDIASVELALIPARQVGVHCSEERTCDRLINSSHSIHDCIIQMNFPPAGSLVATLRLLQSAAQAMSQHQRAPQRRSILPRQPLVPAASLGTCANDTLVSRQATCSCDDCVCNVMPRSRRAVIVDIAVPLQGVAHERRVWVVALLKPLLRVFWRDAGGVECFAHLFGRVRLHNPRLSCTLFTINPVRLATSALHSSSSPVNRHACVICCFK